MVVCMPVAFLEKLNHLPIEKTIVLKNPTSFRTSAHWAVCNHQYFNIQTIVRKQRNLRNLMYFINIVFKRNLTRKLLKLRLLSIKSFTESQKRLRWTIKLLTQLTSHRHHRVNDYNFFFTNPSSYMAKKSHVLSHIKKHGTIPSLLHFEIQLMDDKNVKL